MSGSLLYSFECLPAIASASASACLQPLGPDPPPSSRTLPPSSSDYLDPHVCQLRAPRSVRSSRLFLFSVTTILTSSPDKEWRLFPILPPTPTAVPSRERGEGMMWCDPKTAIPGRPRAWLDLGLGRGRRRAAESKTLRVAGSS
ncbi:hypothetical protein MPTK1_7g10650 [Marchantia polymorpha subsp. ruderalis]|uniref:Uncharacterized protein n=2 Tax=Marchantia polymorpha TaxID=3197 RepID=A0AAF6BY60_MARPO|nr:hypothetical protein MARPO_0003s0080 [Marchantia polymorpha]BBN16944.1 hypothetical protein Mp_7g10650 [Marchantia polymorpha subsp. ruderalis]|eukprot:PTQ49181.1 hypothetical protein MARPO_0003s0080 [Marchantia polymorpha]